MGFFTKEVEKELTNKLPNDKPVLMIRGVLEKVNYSRSKKGVEPVLVVLQNKHRYSIHCKEGIPPKDMELGVEKNFYAVEDVKVITTFVPVLSKDNKGEKEVPFVTGSVDITFNGGGATIKKTMDGNHTIFTQKRTKEKYLRLVGVALDERMLQSK
jgi:hypothetical protein